MVRVALAYAYRCSPVELRAATLAEITAMIDFLEYIAATRGEDVDG